MNLRLTGPVKKLNVEHRTSNIEHRIWMALRFTDYKKGITKFRNVIMLLTFLAHLVISMLRFFFNRPNTLFDVRRSMLTVS